MALNGHQLPAMEALPPKSRRAVSLARLHLANPVGRISWGEQLARYQNLKSPYPLYRLNGGSLVLEDTSLAPERLQAMRRLLETPPDPPTRQARFAPPGRYRFYVHRDAQELEVPERASRISAGVLPLLRSPVAQRTPLTVSLEALQQTADWMDHCFPAGASPAPCWGQRLRGLKLRDITGDGFIPSERLCLDGLLHLIGMVGSGKSSLFTILAVHLSRQGKRVVIVQNDVASLLRELAIFDVLSRADANVRAVPLVGRASRLTHLNRLHAFVGQQEEQRPEHDHPGFQMLSTICPLDGVRRDVDPIPIGLEPCTRLFATRDQNDTPHDCPFMPLCPVHLPSRILTQANIWLATSASLLSSGPQVPLVEPSLRFAEMVMQYADVVLVDEADSVQVQFDDRFAPFEVLIGGEHSWLDRLASQVTRQVYRPARPLVGRNPQLDRWLTTHSNVQRAVDRLYCWIREAASTRKWLGEEYFTADRLFGRIEAKLMGLGGRIEAFGQAQQAFLRAPLRGLRSSQDEMPFSPVWSNAVQCELIDDEEVAREVLEDWIKQNVGLPQRVSPRQVEELAHQLLLALIVAVLEHSLRDLIGGWGVAEESLDVDRGTGGLFYTPSERLSRRIPEPPMGNVFGFQYYDSQRDGNGELRFFSFRGVGRSLLYHLHDAYQLTDGIAGPHVIPTSGTSWAPGSWRYHLHIPPAAALLPQREEHTQETRCFFEPLPDPRQPGKPLVVSGLVPHERAHSLKAMVEALAKPTAFGPSMFDTELDQLDTDRKRILIIVGSYDEARDTGKALQSFLTGQHGGVDNVLTLIPDAQGGLAPESKPGQLLRSLLPRLADHPAQFLVAPLQSVERGHNILVGERAAIGSVYFLVRPFPRPGEFSTAVHRINSWSMEFVPSITTPDLAAAGEELRGTARRQWDALLAEKQTYLGTKNRPALLWTQLVLVWQCVGRLLRGGVAARVHFIDGKWAEVSSGLKPGDGDREETSMLIGFEGILREALADPDPVKREIAKTLYGSFASALADIKGVTRAQP